MALAPLAERNKVPLVGLVASAPELVEGKEWVFRYYITSEGETPPIMVWLKRLAVEKLGILYLEDVYGRSVYASLKEKCRKANVLVKEQGFETKDFDVSRQLGELKDMDAVYVVGLVKHVSDILKQLRKEKYSGIILAASGAAADQICSLPEANDVYIAAPAIYNPNYPYHKRLKEKYAARYNKPLVHQDANGYDFVKLMAGLLEDRDPTRRNLKDILDQGFSYSSVFGPLTVSAGEHNIPIPLFPARIVGNKIEYH